MKLDIKKTRWQRASIMTEIYLWFFICILISGRPLYYYFFSKASIQDIIFEFYSEFLVSMLILLFPFLFKQIFSEFPMEYIRKRRQQVNVKEETEKIRKDKTNVKETAIPSETNFVKVEIHLLERNLQNSQELSEKVYSRSGAYLLIGCLIALTGVLLFYSQTSSIHIVDELTWTDITIAYMPRIGTLIFVEALAFFFLKQYRLTMDEFRYYDAIKRQRENQLTTLKFLYEFKDKPELFDKLIKAISFNENPDKLQSGETTTLIESKKLSAQDVDVFEKILELMKLIKK